MPLYLVKENEKPDRLVDAKSASGAIGHVTGERFTAELITNPMTAAELVGGGLKVEKAGETPPPSDDKGDGKTGGDGKDACVKLPGEDDHK